MQLLPACNPQEDANTRSEPNGRNAWCPACAAGDCMVQGYDPPHQATVIQDADSATDRPLLTLPKVFQLVWSDEAAPRDKGIAIWRPVPQDGCVIVTACCAVRRPVTSPLLSLDVLLPEQALTPWKVKHWNVISCSSLETMCSLCNAVFIRSKASSDGWVTGMWQWDTWPATAPVTHLHAPWFAASGKQQIISDRFCTCCICLSV